MCVRRCSQKVLAAVATVYYLSVVCDILVESNIPMIFLVFLNI